MAIPTETNLLRSEISSRHWVAYTARLLLMQKVPMATYSQRSISVAALLQISFVLSAAGRRARVLAKTLDTWITRRRAAQEALAALSAMSDRELRDIGLARSDIERIAWHRPVEPGDIRRIG
jgi:uncharacterized protein YjiS (DUF1127 family)